MFLRALTTVAADDDQPPAGTYDARLGYRVLADDTPVVCEGSGTATATVTKAERDRDDSRAGRR